MRTARRTFLGSLGISDSPKLREGETEAPRSQIGNLSNIKSSPAPPSCSPQDATGTGTTTHGTTMAPLPQSPSPPGRIQSQLICVRRSQAHLAPHPMCPHRHPDSHRFQNTPDASTTLCLCAHMLFFLPEMPVLLLCPENSCCSLSPASRPPPLGRPPDAPGRSHSSHTYSFIQHWPQVWFLLSGLGSQTNLRSKALRSCMTLSKFFI